jgi:uncharacterized protein YndB with AHSA1/START domain
MKTHDVQSVSIAQPARFVFDYVAKPENLPKWTNAFSRADGETADLVTGAGRFRSVSRRGPMPRPERSIGK